MSLLNRIEKESKNALDKYYQDDINYTSDNYYFREHCNNVGFEDCASYKKWNNYYSSDEYKIHLNYIIDMWKEDIVNGFTSYMKKKINNPYQGEYIRSLLIIANHHYDNTFEYIENAYSEGLYNVKFNYKYIYDIFQNNVLDNMDVVCVK